MNPLTTFCWGFFGSFAVEVISIYHAYQNDQELPRRYKLVGFWVVRVTVAIIAGGLAIGYDIHSPLLAANVGAATPLIIQAFGRGLKPPQATIE